MELTPVHLKAFTRLKVLQAKSTEIVHPSFGAELHRMVDASNIGTSGVLHQNSDGQLVYLVFITKTLQPT